jgi:microcystin-dependent protein
VSEPFLSEIRLVSFNFPPKGWAFCTGQLLPINQNQALFSLLGTTYGGDGRVNFGLPNLQGRSPNHIGNGFGLGQFGGEQSHTLTAGELPAHLHPITSSDSAANTADPTGAYLANSSNNNFIDRTSADGAMDPSTISATGGGQPHNNLQPFLCLTYIIALQGIFPSQN